MNEDELEEKGLFLGEDEDEKDSDEEDPLSMGFHEVEPIEPELDF